MKSLELIYQDTEIHFLVNPTEKNVMINATEMAKAFGKQTKLFLKAANTKAFIEAMKRNPDCRLNGTQMVPVQPGERPPFGGRSNQTSDDLSTHIRVDKEAQSVSERAPNGARSEYLSDDDIIQRRGHAGTYFHQVLALKFAGWLDPDFELWVYYRIRDMLFGNYQQHLDAHVSMQNAQRRMEQLKNELLQSPSVELVEQYFQAETDYKAYKALKRSTLREQQNQLKLFK